MQATPSKTPEERGGRIESHGTGVGAPTPEAVKCRAREIARIDGRPGEDMREADFVRASRELHNTTLVVSDDEARSERAVARNPADVAVDTGHKVPDMQPVDEQRIREKEVQEGLREAEHERMLEGQQMEKDAGGASLLRFGES